MATAPIQYDLPPASSDLAYRGTPGPAQAAQAGEYTKNTQGLRRITLVLSGFRPPPIRPPQR